MTRDEAKNMVEHAVNADCGVSKEELIGMTQVITQQDVPILIEEMVQAGRILEFLCQIPKQEPTWLYFPADTKLSPRVLK